MSRKSHQLTLEEARHLRQAPSGDWRLGKIQPAIQRDGARRAAVALATSFAKHPPTYLGEVILCADMYDPLPVLTMRRS